MRFVGVDAWLSDLEGALTEELAAAMVPAATESAGEAAVMAVARKLPCSRMVFGASPDEVPAPPRITAR